MTDSDGGLRRWWWFDLGLPVVVLALGTFVFWDGSHDLALQAPHYSEESGWRDAAQPWKALYDFGVLPTALLTLACIVALPLSYRMPRVRRYRATSIFFLGVMALGPLLVANVVLKNNWDRPRPRQVEDFGGRYAFEHVLQRDSESKGKSFPCGHAAAVFAVSSIFFILRERRRTRRLAWFLLFLGTGFGTATAYARMVQGGHFASDGLWAWGLMMLSAASLYWFLRLAVRKAPLLDDPGAGTEELGRLPLVVKLFTGLLVLTFFATFFLAIPYNAGFEIAPFQKETAQPLPLRYNLHIPKGDVEVAGGETVRWQSEVSGHGYAGSRVSESWTEKLEDDGARYLSYQQNLSGFFTELVQDGRLELPHRLVTRLRVRLGEGDLELRIPSRSELRERADWVILCEGGEVLVVVPSEGLPDFEIRGLDLEPTDEAGILRSYAEGTWRAGGIPQLVIKNEVAGTRFRIVRETQPPAAE